MTVDASGNLLSALKYTAYGELRSGTSTTDYQYTGQRSEIETGLYFYVSRFYDPQLARFISADTLVPEAGNAKAYDRYMYVNGNPVNYNDPSGHRLTECGLDGQDCGEPGSSSGGGGGSSGGSGGAGSTGSGNGGGNGGGESSGNSGSDDIGSPSQISIVDQYVQGWQLVGTAWGILNNPDADLEDWAISGGYILGWVGAHIALGVGVGGLVCVATGPGCVAAVEGVLGIGGTTAVGLQQISNKIIPYYPPNLGFSGTPKLITLQPGEMLSRYGSTAGKFLSPVGTSAWTRSLPPGTENLTLYTYQVIKPIENVLSGPAASWWGKIGGANQFYIGTQYGQNVQTLIDSGFLEPR